MKTGWVIPAVLTILGVVFMFNDASRKARRRAWRKLTKEVIAENDLLGFANA